MSFTRAAPGDSHTRPRILLAPLGVFLRGYVLKLDLTGAAVRGGALRWILAGFDAFRECERRVHGREVIRLAVGERDLTFDRTIHECLQGFGKPMLPR